MHKIIFEHLSEDIALICKEKKKHAILMFVKSQFFK